MIGTGKKVDWFGKRKEIFKCQWCGLETIQPHELNHKCPDGIKLVDNRI